MKKKSATKPSPSPKNKPAAVKAKRAAPSLPGIEVVDMTAPSPEPTPEPVIEAPAPVAAPASFVEQISDEGRDRAAADEAMARAAGFAPKPPVYALGTLINSTGVANLTRSRVEFEALPTVAEAMSALAIQVRREDREDVPVILRDARMTETGSLCLGDGTELAMTHNGMRLLAHRLIGSYDYMAKCPPALRALNVNHWLPKLDTPVVLRTRKGATGREVYGVVSERYSPMDVDLVAEMIARVTPAGARCDVTYDGLELTANVLFHTDIDAKGGVAGEFFKAGAVISTRDDGTGSMQVEAELWRNLCLNLIILDHAKQTTARRNHVGADLDVSLQLGIERALEKVGGFAAQWSGARTENVVAAYGLASAEQALERLAANRVVTAPGVRPEAMKTALLSAWQVEPGDTRADIVNAITRAAHSTPWARLETSSELERTAGQLLYARDFGRFVEDRAAL